MRQSLKIIILIISFSRVLAQSYIPMFGELTEWSTVNCFSGQCLTDSYSVNGDTIVNGVSYRFLDGYHYNRNFLIREDTVTSEVFMRLNIPMQNRIEYKVYDFSLTPGDSVQVYNPISPVNLNGGWYYVDSTKMINLMHDTRKFLYLSKRPNDGTAYTTTIWVEGIGSLSLINTPGVGPDADLVAELLCYKKDGVQFYQSPNNLNGECRNATANISSHKPYKSFNVSPNPSNDVVTIEFLLGTSGNLTFEIISLEGKMVQVIDYGSVEASRLYTEEIDIDRLPAGIYAIRAKSNSDILFKRKIIVTD